MTWQFIDYDKVTLDDYAGAIYEAKSRSADYQWLRPGYTEIHLEGLDIGGDYLRITGWIAQGEKAEGVCLLWLEAGEISINLNIESK